MNLRRSDNRLGRIGRGLNFFRSHHIDVVILTTWLLVHTAGESSAQVSTDETISANSGALAGGAGGTANQIEADSSATAESLPPRRIRDIQPFADYTPPRSESVESGSFSLPSLQEESDDTNTQHAAIPPALPPEVTLDGNSIATRHFADTSFAWKASDLFSNPLFFEDAPLERYGHAYCDPVQPFVSAGLFSTQLVGLPYQMAIDPFCSKMYSLGWYRPGEWAPHKLYQVPLSLRAAAAQARVMAGMVFLLP